MAGDTPPLTIAEIGLIDEIEALSVGYGRLHGRPVVNVSYWDPSRAIIEKLRERLPVAFERDPISYRYSYQIDTRERMLAKLGVTNPSVAALIADNGSSSITAVANWLALSTITEITVLPPCYFTVPY